TSTSTEAPTRRDAYIFAYDSVGASSRIAALSSLWLTRGVVDDPAVPALPLPAAGRGVAAAILPTATASHTALWLFLSAACSRTLGCTIVLAALNSVLFTAANQLA